MFRSQERGIAQRGQCQYWLILVGGLTVALLLLILVPSSAWANPSFGVFAQTIPPTIPPTEPPPPPTEPPTVPPTKVPFPEPSPEPSPEPTKKRPPDEPCSRGEISGIVTDDCQTQPAANVQVQIDGAVVTTDSQGHFSLSGLSDGRYTVQLLVPNAPPPVTVDLLCDQVLVLNLTYNSCPPEATPAAPEFLPVTGGTSGPSGGLPMVWLVAGATLLGLGVSTVLLTRRRTRS